MARAAHFFIFVIFAEPARCREGENAFYARQITEPARPPPANTRGRRSRCCFAERFLFFNFTVSEALRAVYNTTGRARSRGGARRIWDAPFRFIAVARLNLGADYAERSLLATAGSREREELIMTGVLYARIP